MIRPSARHFTVALSLIVVAGCAGDAAGARPSHLPPDKQARQDHYDRDREAARRNEHPRSEDGPPPTPTPSAGATDEGDGGFAHRRAGKGTIVETGDSGPPTTKAEFVFTNEWYAEDATQVVSIYAGARRANEAQGVLLVNVFDAGEKHLVRWFVVPTPTAGGIARVVSATGANLTIEGSAGGRWVFDADALAFR